MNRTYSVWWLKPAWAFGCPLVIVCILAAIIPDSVYRISWKTPKYIDTYTVVCTFLSVGAFAMASALGSALGGSNSREPWEDKIPWTTLMFLFTLSACLCMAGYLAWIVTAVSRGLSLSDVLGALTGQKGVTYRLRVDYLGTVKGVTTMTQFGVAAIIMGVPLGFVKGWKKVRLWMVAIFVMAFLRAIVNSERLAAIELACPFVVLYVHFRYLRHKAPSRLMLLAPFAAMIAIFGFFIAGEYSRSWVTFYENKSDQTLVTFGGQRIIGYYATALNNTALLTRQLSLPLNAPFFTFNFLWRFPILSDLVRAGFNGQGLPEFDDYMDLLANGANPEFNNTGGVLLPVMDFGLGGGLFYWLAIGGFIGYLYGSFRRMGAAGLLLYPVFFTGLIETPRILYWSDGRFFPAFCMLALSALLFSTERRKHTSVRWIQRAPAVPVRAVQ